MRNLLKTIALTTVALTATGISVTAAAAVKTLTVDTPVIWDVNGTKVNQSNSGTYKYLAPRPSVELIESATTNFVAYPKTGQYVEWWSYGVDTRSDKAGWVDATGKPNVISNSSETFTWSPTTSAEIWTMKADATEAGLGCKFAWIPFRVVYHSEDETEQAEGTHTYPETFDLDPNPFEREGYTFDHWRSEDGTRTYADRESVSGESLGVVSNWVVDLYAVWSANGYTVAFDGHGATAGSMTSQDFVYDEEQALKANAFTRSYVVSFDANGGTPGVESATAKSRFDGWSKTPGGAVAYRDGEVVKNLAASGNATLYASWTPGSVTLPSASRSGSTFAGWYTAASGGTRVGGSGDTYQPTEPVTVHAQWVERFRVTFEYRDATGDWIVSSPQFVDDGGSAMLPTGYDQAPGYTFLSWSEDYRTITRDTYIKANYDTNHYYLYFEPNAEGVSGEMERLDCAYDESYVLGNGFSRVGYVLREWNTKADGSGAGYAVGASVKKLSATRWDRVYLYAQWAPISYTVSFDANGGEGTMNALTLNYDEVQALPANAFTKGESVFRHWSHNGKTYADGAVVSNLTDVAGGTVVLKAIWKEAYWVDYAANGGEGTMPRQTFYVGETGTLAAVTFERLGCTFAGWRTNDLQTIGFFTNCAAVVDLAPAGETNTLTAVWSNNAYSVSFYPNGGEGEMPDQPLHCHEPQELVSNAFTRVNGTFRGWALDPVAAEPNYADGQEVTNLTYTTNATVKLYALWEIAQPGITSPIAVALDAPTLFFSTDFTGDEYDQRWSIVSNATDAAPGGNNQYLRTFRPAAASYCVSKMSCTLPRGKGTFSFSYRTFVDESKSSRGAFSFLSSDDIAQLETKARVEEWTTFVYRKETADEEVCHWQMIRYGGNTDDYADVDLVTWRADDPALPTVGITFRLNDGTPAPNDIWDNLTVSSGVKFAAWPVDPTSSMGKHFQGWFTAASGGEPVTAESLAPVMDTTYYAQWSGGFPVPGPDDVVEASAVTVSGGAFGVSFAANPDFAYYLLATDALVPADWQRILGPVNGTGTQTFTPPIDAQHPQRFFKIETVQREE